MQVRLCSHCGWMLPHGPEICRYPKGPLPQRGLAEPPPDPERAFDEGRRAIRAGAELRRCTPLEWALLNLLRRRQGSVLSAARLHSVWDTRSDAICDTSLKVYLCRLRQKLRGSGWTIRNVWGQGWALEQGGVTERCGRPRIQARRTSRHRTASTAEAPTSGYPPAS